MRHGAAMHYRQPGGLVQAETGRGLLVVRLELAPYGWLVTFGAMLTLAGWAIVIWTLLGPQRGAGFLGYWLVREEALLILRLAECLIVTGCAMALFGLLTHYLGGRAPTAEPIASTPPPPAAALATRPLPLAHHAAPQQLASMPTPAAQRVIAAPQAIPQEFERPRHRPMAAIEQAYVGMDDALHGTPATAAAIFSTSPVERREAEVVTHGEVSGRKFTLYSDGSVVIATLLGPRRFDSLAEAKEFIGPQP